ncbi:MAG: hypothetical protein FWG87_13095 [Defluviitaleaceae bacterium]|nr:hypothetical protein [Defluviitaleaceae bacterium]
MGLLDNLMNDPEIGGRLSDISSGTNKYSSQADRYKDVPYGSTQGGREAYDMADKLGSDMRGDGKKW